MARNIHHMRFFVASLEGPTARTSNKAPHHFRGAYSHWPRAKTFVWRKLLFGHMVSLARNQSTEGPGLQEDQDPQEIQLDALRTSQDPVRGLSSCPWSSELLSLSYYLYSNPHAKLMC